MSRGKHLALKLEEKKRKVVPKERIFQSLAY